MSFDQENFPELPSTWVSISVEDAYANVSISEKIPTKSYSSKGKLAVVDQGSAHIGGFTDEIEKAVNVEIPVIVFGDHTRSIKFVDFPFAAGADGIKILKPNTYFVPKLFYWFLKAIKLPDKGYARHFQYLRTSQIALPPLNEQKRIADKLDRLLAKVDACRERCDRIPLILKRFRQSVLAAATSGELTEDWREEDRIIDSAHIFLRSIDPKVKFLPPDVLGNIEIPKSWAITNFGNVVSNIRGGSTAVPQDEPTKFPILRSSSVRPCSVDLDDFRYVSEKNSQNNLNYLSEGDLLFTRLSGSLD
jgi:restriction endonuclease S subunit